MSAIGDYIHFNGHHYDDYGTNRNSGSFNTPNLKSYQAVINDRLKASSAGLTPDELDEIAKTISAFMEEGIEKDTVSMSALETKLLETFNKEIVDTLNYNTMKSSASTENAVGKVSAKKGDNGLYLDLEQLVKKINQLEKAYLNSNLSIKALNHLKSEIAKEVGISWQAIRNKTPEQLKIFATNNPIQGKGMKQIRDNINNAINTYASFPNISSLEGTGFEYILPLALKDTAHTSIKEAIEAITVSNTGANIKYIDQYGAENFTSSVITAGNSILKFKYNQRAKVDVALEWQGKDLRISAKNVSFNKDYKWIHLVSESPLLYLIQDIDGTFINHYINVISLTASKKAKEWKKLIADSLKQYIFYKAATGDVYNSQIKDNANLLVVNDKTGKNKVKVYDMESLYKKASEKLENISVKANGEYLYSINLAHKNKFSNSAEERINNLLTEVHRLKVNVSFNAGSVLK